MLRYLPMLFLVPALYAQDYPKPLPTTQAIIDKDNGRHFGDSPADPGPLATGLSAALKPADIDVAMRKVADWELKRNSPYFDQIWTSSVDYTGFMALYRSTGDVKYRDAMVAVAKKYDWKPRGKGANADDQSIGQMYLGTLPGAACRQAGPVVDCADEGRAGLRDRHQAGSG